MNLSGNISEGGRRLGIVAGALCAIPGTLIGAMAGSLIVQAVDLRELVPFGLVIGGFVGMTLGWWLGVGVVRALTWVVRGFVGD